MYSVVLPTNLSMSKYIPKFPPHCTVGQLVHYMHTRKSLN